MEPTLRNRDTGLEGCSWDGCRLPRTHEGVCDEFPPVIVLYTNWKGRQAKRKVSPTGQIVHEANEWHKVPQWLVEAIDHEDGKQKRFALRGVNGGRDALVQAIVLRWHNA